MPEQYYVGNIMANGESLYHHGILGMKWGVRRFQNEDGSLTAAGKSRYGSSGGETRKPSARQKQKEDRINKARKVNASYSKAAEQYKNFANEYNKGVELAKKVRGYNKDPFAFNNEVEAAHRGKGSKEAADYVEQMKKAELARKKYNTLATKYDSELIELGREFGGSSAKTYRFAQKVRRKDEKDAKKAAKQAEIKKASKEYKKAFDESTKLSDKSYEYEVEAKTLYKKLGSNVFQRAAAVRAAQNGKGTKEAKRYVKLMEKASQLQDKSDEIWDNDARSARKRMGKTGISRTINAIRYT